jgi:hypothetical protein
LLIAPLSAIGAVFADFVHNFKKQLWIRFAHESLCSLRSS